MTSEVSLHLSEQRMMPLSSVQLFQLSWQARCGLSCSTTFCGKVSSLERVICHLLMDLTIKDIMPRKVLRCMRSEEGW